MKPSGDLSQYTKAELLHIGDEWADYGWVKPVKKYEKITDRKNINLPLWKQDFIRKNRVLYANNKSFIDKWLKKWEPFAVDEEGKRKIPVSRTKYEWQAGAESRTNWENIFQFRPSGIRVKKGDYFPALVAMAQIPVVGWLKRHITPKECARIQSFDVDGKYGTPFKLGSTVNVQAMGNAANVNMIMIQERVDEFLSGSPNFLKTNIQSYFIDTLFEFKN